MEASDSSLGSTEKQLDLDFRLNIVKGSIKAAMKQGGLNGKSFTAGDLWNVDPRVIKVIPGYNIRERNSKYFAAVEKYKRSMMDVGFKKDSALSVIVVAEEDGSQSIYLKRGHQRLEAVIGAIDEGAPISTVPCIIDSDNISEEDMTTDLVTSNNGTPLDPYPLAVACKRMTRFYPENHSAIAKKLGLWPNQVSDYLLLINGPIEICNYVRQEVVTFTLAIELMKEHGAKALEVIEKGLARSAIAGGSANKLMPRFVPGKFVKKAVTKAAPAMRTAILGIREDKGFEHLSPANQQALEEILNAFKEAEAVEEKLNAENPEPELNLETVEV
ncbi:hypothetical protein [Pseudomonas abietaniphila]|uniref:Chromosome partitioning protein, ParB family n=1 Tax=Pseudomonas abietaniphila TaxID=89065 RepID=A0A1G8QWY8_9PSED|nr:hypothetical protein [Pseudomonas abietaniphila]SDJ08825.1 hypothetical protein SAMN05216605_12180 [Pseudomonas abietaniphila]